MKRCALLFILALAATCAPLFPQQPTSPMPTSSQGPPAPVAASAKDKKDKNLPPIPEGITLCVAPMTGNFDGYLIGEMRKQQVPVTIISAAPTAADPAKFFCDPAKSYFTMYGTVDPEGKSFSARAIFGLRLHLRDEIQAAVKLVPNSDSTIVWAGDSDRGETKKVAEHIVNQMLKQRPTWIPSPINR